MYIFSPTFILESRDTVNIPVARTNVSCASVLVRFRKTSWFGLKYPFVLFAMITNMDVMTGCGKTANFGHQKKKMQTSPAVLTSTAVSCLPAVLT